MCKSAHEKIFEIYSNDGPGFSREFQELPEMKEMMPKDYTYYSGVFYYRDASGA